jgi:hypothetical protein
MRHEDEERCLSAIQMTLQFYNKKMDDITRKFWRQWLRQQRNPELVLDALRQYPNEGKFAPKPADIQAIIELIRPPKSTVKEEEVVDNCPPEIRKAWTYWIPQFWDQPMPFKETAEPVSEDQAEAWLILINQEAKRCNTPEAIPDTHKLQEIWA